MPKNQIQELYIRRLADSKKDEASFLLEGTVGLFLRTKSSVFVAARAPGIIQIRREIDKNTNLWILGITSSQTEARNFESEFVSLEENFKNLLSLRDLNITVVRDFICRLIQDNLYASNSEKSMPYEFVIVQATCNSLNFSVVDYEGNYRIIGPTDVFDVFGCTSAKKRKKITEALTPKAGLLSDVLKDKMVKAIASASRKYGGDLYVATFDFLTK